MKEIQPNPWKPQHLPYRENFSSDPLVLQHISHIPASPAPWAPKHSFSYWIFSSFSDCSSINVEYFLKSFDLQNAFGIRIETFLKVDIIWPFHFNSICNQHTVLSPSRNKRNGYFSSLVSLYVFITLHLVTWKSASKIQCVSLISLGLAINIGVCQISKTKPSTSPHPLSKILRYIHSSLWGK